MEEITANINPNFIYKISRDSFVRETSQRVNMSE
jgi:hypothetical protein